MGAAANNPEKNRVHNNALYVSLEAEPRLKTNEIKNGNKTPGFRPYTSENGAKIIGPNATPNTYKDVASVATVSLTPNRAIKWAVVGAIAELLYCAANVVIPYNAV
jgi:hypothetical protein